ncbi:MAG: DEAD/DEAH box helicase [Prevotellaceae bacterium]|jgi:superfamily II DNA or RNA helicase|nr:DEAD/DEAH box helicase [Prevotellaceae bacterium]
MMLPAQKKYYDSLKDIDKAIVQIALFCAVDIDLSSLSRFCAAPFITKYVTQKKIKQVMDDAEKAGLFVQSYYSGRMANTDCLIALYPDLKTYKPLWSQVKKEAQYSWMYYTSSTNNSTESVRMLRNCLYALLFDNKLYSGYEHDFLSKYPQDMIDFCQQIITDEQYASSLKYISKEVMTHVCSDMMYHAFNDLLPVSTIKSYIDRLSGLNGKIDFNNEKVFLQNVASLYRGILDNEDTNTDYTLCLTPFIHAALLDEPQKAMNIAEQSLKEEKKENNSAFPFFIRSIDVYYYLLVLMQLDVKVSIPVLEKIIKWNAKHPTLLLKGFMSEFNAIVYDFAGKKQEDATYYANIVKENLTGNKEGVVPIDMLYNVLIYYAIGKSCNQNSYKKLLDLYERAIQGECYLLAYEMSYVLDQWYHTPSTAKIYANLAKQFSYTPMISRIRIQSEWEKTLNLLLTLEKGKKVKNAKEKEQRIAYFFNPNNTSIQPVLQMRQAKGWSKGRNIALSTFASGTVAGMTEQDARIALCITTVNNGYPTFKRSVLSELVGHPHIFLDGTENTPVEFIGTKPIIAVKENSKGYLLTTDLTVQEWDDNIRLVKETNTRYKIYSLTATQREMLNILYLQKLIVPLQGKDKLIELLGTFSAAGMNVHSDLISSQDAAVPVKEVPADSRIRIQLLPYGDGLKAELFSKPFGTQPPYCKPGKGGKALIASDGEGQLQVTRNLQKEKENESALMNDIQALESLDINDGLMSFGDPLDSLQILDIALKHAGQCVVEWPEGERLRLRGAADTSHLQIQIKSGINWFDLSGELKVNEDTVVSLQQLLALTATGHRGFIELKTGEYLALSATLKKQLDAIRLFSAETKGKTRLNKFASAALNEVFGEMDELKELKADKQWKEFHRTLDTLQQTTADIPLGLQAELRPYQEEGFRWMARLAGWNAGACLADEMGLGKTLQALAILLYRANLGAALVVCPVSVIGNWLNEAERFAPSLRVQVLSTTGNGRREVMQALRAGDVLVTSYGLLQSEDELFAEFDYATIVLDEAHVIKNYATKTSKATMSLKGAFRIALTGTPVQNHPGEIWNLFNFINPGLLGSLKHFNETFIKSPDEQTRKYLKKLIAPFILRRTKAGVIDELPPKTEIVKRITLSDEEMAFYEALRRQALENLSNDTHSSGAKHIQVLAEITRLRQACCNPALITPDMHIPSTKLNTFLDLMGELRENNHRALVFSQFVTHLTLVRKVLDKQGISYQYIDGATPVKERQKRVDAFQNGEGELFLISLKAGGLGLNLTAADYVIHLDPWWNPAVEDQASDRAHRIGQKRPVTIYRLVAENTIEEKIIQLHSRKRDLAESLLEGSDQAAKLSLEEIMELLKEGE